jgi:hypothetical protein
MLQVTPMIGRSLPPGPRRGTRRRGFWVGVVLIQTFNTCTLRDSRAGRMELGFPTCRLFLLSICSNSTGAQGLRPGVATQGQPGQSGNGGQSLQGFVNSPIDVPSLIALKGYNPSNFDIRPQFVSRLPRPVKALPLTRAFISLIGTFLRY